MRYYVSMSYIHAIQNRHLMCNSDYLLELQNGLHRIGYYDVNAI